MNTAANTITGSPSLPRTPFVTGNVASTPAAMPRGSATLVIHHKDGTRRDVRVTLRIDTPIEVDYYKHGGILPFVLRQLLA